MKFNKTTLENGLRIITVPQPNTVAFTALVLVETGSKYENKSNSGVAHFLEHMCFKGTEKRPEPNQVTLELENLGAQNNAFTSHEYTGYYAKVASTKAPKALELVADLYINPLLRQEDIDIEKGVIIEEINMYEDMPQRKA
ncbi:MAG: pitrilysin family protein, partial [Candidatus Paceibacterota bacterium]